MSTTHTDPTTRTTGRPWWRAGLVAGAAAAVVNVVVAVIASAADVSMEVAGDEIPLVMFAVASLFGTVLGLVLAEVLARRAARPARTFAIVATVLAVLSFGSPLAADASGGTIGVLVLTHVLAALIVIPVVVRQLPANRG